MNETKTASMLRRIPVILAVTAASYGLQVPQQAMRWSAASQPRPVSEAPDAEPAAGSRSARIGRQKNGA